MSSFLRRNKSLLIYGLSLALLLLLLKWLQLRIMIMDHSFEIYMGAIALLFTGLGIWVAVKLSRPRVEKVVEEKIIYVKDQSGFVLNEAEVSRLRISKRELEVLQLMAEGLSNQEIADRLFVAVSTIKTHSSSLFEKLEVKRRTQAIEKSKTLGLIP